MENYYVQNKQRFVARLNKELPFWLSALQDLHPNKITTDLGDRLRNRFEELLPNLPYIGGDENKMTLSLLDAARYLIFYQEMKGMIATEHIAEVLHSAVILRQQSRGIAFYEQNTYTPEEVTEYRKGQALMSQRKEYPEDYVYEYIEEEGSDYGYNFTECGALKLFRAHDAMEMLPYFCYLDYPKMLNSGQMLRRDKALSLGDSFCNHRFSAGEQGNTRWPPVFKGKP